MTNRNLQMVREADSWKILLDDASEGRVVVPTVDGGVYAIIKL